MNKIHAFIFSPGKWLGEGKIQLNHCDEELIFFTRWTIFPETEGEIVCIQEIQIKGIPDMVRNHFRVFSHTATTFELIMESEAMGMIEGTGMIQEGNIGWEFRIPDLGFEGFEYYQQESSSSYSMKAEFATADQLRTVLQGRIWQQAYEEKSCISE